MKTEELYKEHVQELISNFTAYIPETEPQQLFTMLNQLLQDCGFHILKFTEHYFEPQGYTCLWLLGESHLAVHTFPERGVSYLELSSCNEEKNEAFRERLKDILM